MTTFRGRGIIAGRGRGRALVTTMPMNFTAALTKPANVLPNRRAEIQDRHHDLYGQNIKGSVLVFPSCIGSTYTGMVLLELMAQGHAPAAMVVGEADSLLVSGAVLAEVWFDRGIPIVEYDGGDLFESIMTGVVVDVDGGTGEIKVD